jgi:hypothetical protein
LKPDQKEKEVATDKYMTVIDHALFGEIVRGWANDLTTLPATIEDFEGQVDPLIVQIGLGYDRKDPVNFVKIPPTSTTVSFVIPDKDDIKDPVPPGAYELPRFYREMAFFDKPVSVLEKNKELFRSARIADYSAGKCM